MKRRSSPFFEIQASIADQAAALGIMNPLALPKKTNPWDRIVEIQELAQRPMKGHPYASA